MGWWHGKYYSNSSCCLVRKLLHWAWKDLAVSQLLNYLLTVALRLSLEQIKKKFPFCFWNCKNDNIRLNSLKAPAHQGWWSPQLSCLLVFVGDLELVQGQSWHCDSWPSWKEYGWEEESRHIGSWWQGVCSGADPRRSFKLWPPEAPDAGLKGLVHAPNPDWSDFFFFFLPKVIVLNSVGTHSPYDS